MTGAAAKPLLAGVTRPEGSYELDELKRRQGAIWGSAPLEQIAATVRDVHEHVIERLDPRPGERLLDLACGSGPVAELAAQRGASVIGVDFALALLETAKGRAAERGLEIEYQVSDVEQLPCEYLLTLGVRR